MAFLGAVLLAVSALEVRVEGDRVRVRAERVSLAAVLDRLAEGTGMKVEWGPNLGRPLVSARIDDATPLEAVVQVMQGTAFNYALTTDAARLRVQKLLIVGVPRPGPPAQGFVPRPSVPDDDVGPAPDPAEGAPAAPAPPLRPPRPDR